MLRFIANDLPLSLVYISRDEQPHSGRSLMPLRVGDAWKYNVRWSPQQVLGSITTTILELMIPF